LLWFGGIDTAGQRRRCSAAASDHSIDAVALTEHRHETANGSRATLALGRLRRSAVVRLEIVDPEQYTLAAQGQIGEVWVSSPSAPGYWETRADRRLPYGWPTAATAPFANWRLDFGDDSCISGPTRTGYYGRNYYPQIWRTPSKILIPLRPSSCAAFSIDRDGKALVIVQELNANTADSTGRVRGDHPGHPPIADNSISSRTRSNW
jgi:hypothetical protein